MEQLSTMRAHDSGWGALGAQVQEGTIDDVFVKVDLPRQFTSHSTIGGLGNHSVFRSDYSTLRSRTGTAGSSTSVRIHGTLFRTIQYVRNAVGRAPARILCRVRNVEVPAHSVLFRHT